MQDEYEPARTFYNQALPLYEQIGARLGQANTLRALGDVALAQNEYEPARDYYEGALALAEQIGNFRARLNCLWNLGRLERALGNTEAACEYFRRALALADSHPFFKAHPVVQGWRDEYAAQGCDGELEAPAQND